MELEFVDQEITAYGGLAILKQMLTQSGFVSKIEMVSNFWLRSGNSHKANNFKAFLEETLSFFWKQENRATKFDFLNPQRKYLNNTWILFSRFHNNFAVYNSKRFEFK